MWRSLVACMNGVHEAGSSSLLTQTTSEQSLLCSGLFFCLRQKNKPSACSFARPLWQKVTFGLAGSDINVLAAVDCHCRLLRVQIFIKILKRHLFRKLLTRRNELCSFRFFYLTDWQPAEQLFYSLYTSVYT